MNRELLENVFVTALEGGSNYWYLINEVNHKRVRKLVPKSDDAYFATAMLTAILDHNAEIEVHDLENPDEVLGVLKAETIQERLEDLDTHLDYRWALVAEEEGTGDAETSDIVFQYLVLGDVWFS